MPGYGIRFYQPIQCYADLLRRQSLQPGTRASQVAIGEIRRPHQADPILAVVTAQQRRSSIDQLDRLNDPGIYQSQSQAHRYAQ